MNIRALLKLNKVEVKEPSYYVLKNPPIICETWIHPGSCHLQSLAQGQNFITLSEY